jgi:hypothetical protein
VDTTLHPDAVDCTATLVSVPRFEFQLSSAASPEAVRAALLDFSDGRPQRWPGLPPDSYKVYQVGATWAEVREGYRGPIWWRERYDWSNPNAIRWTAVDSGFGQPGSYVVWEMMSAEGGGSTHHIIWDRGGKTAFGKLFMGLMALTRGYFIRQSFQMGLDAIEARTGGESVDRAAGTGL